MNKLKYMLGSLLLFYSVTSISQQNNNLDAKTIYNRGYAAYQTKNYLEAVKLFNQSANLGDVDSYYYLGKMYQNGYGLTYNSKEAFRLYKIAAEKGSSSAQETLGIAYLKGDSTTFPDILAQDFKEALKYLKMCLMQDNTSCITWTAMIYLIETPYKDPAEAFRLYTIAANRGYSDAQNSLGNIYFEGSIVPKNNIEALKWYQLSFNDKKHFLPELPAYYIGKIYVSNEGIPVNHNLAEKYFKVVIENKSGLDRKTLNIDDAKYHLAEIYYQDKRNSIEAFKLAKESADSGNNAAQILVWQLYEEGFGVSKNEKEGLKYLRKLEIDSETIDPSVKYFLGSIYHSKRNYNEASKWYILAANQGNADAQFYIWTYYINNLANNISQEQAFHFLFLAANQRNSKAELLLALEYLSGRFLKQNNSEAFKWAKLSKQHGNQDATEVLRKYFNQ